MLPDQTYIIRKNTQTVKSLTTAHNVIKQVIHSVTETNMTKKDFIVIAKVMAIYTKAMASTEAQLPEYRVTASALLREIIFKLGDEFIKDNPRFDSHKFSEACGIKN